MTIDHVIIAIILWAAFMLALEILKIIVGVAGLLILGIVAACKLYHEALVDYRNSFGRQGG